VNHTPTSLGDLLTLTWLMLTVIGGDECTVPRRPIAELPFDPREPRAKASPPYFIRSFSLVFILETTRKSLYTPNLGRRCSHCKVTIEVQLDEAHLNGKVDEVIRHKCKLGYVSNFRLQLFVTLPKGMLVWQMHWSKNMRLYQLTVRDTRALSRLTWSKHR
jgi:hypothetical protein